MAEYIEREALIKHIERSFGEISTPFVVKEIKDFPDADVVEVVRCKDCKHYKTDSYYCQKTKQGYCELDNSVKRKQGYCSYGERRCEE